jgi:hypothetical protein
MTSARMPRSGCPNQIPPLRHQPETLIGVQMALSYNDLWKAARLHSNGASPGAPARAPVTSGGR